MAPDHEDVVGPEEIEEHDNIKAMRELLEKYNEVRDQLTTFFELSPDLMTITDDNGNFVWVSHSWLTVLGWNPRDLEGKPFVDFVHPDDREHTIPVKDKEGLPNVWDSFRNRYRTPEGQYVRLTWQTRVDGDKGLVYAVARPTVYETGANPPPEDK